MRKTDIQDLIQLLGMVGIIGSLIFVGLEMKKSQNFAELPSSKHGLIQP